VTKSDIVVRLRRHGGRLCNEAAAMIEMLRERQRIGGKIWRGIVKARREGKPIGGMNAQSLREQSAARERAESLRPLFAELAGKSARQIAAELNRRNVPTPTGGRWHSVTVLRAQRRLEAE
jgi:DNA invertase Pin-like site-specific DNA recombinase